MTSSVPLEWTQKTDQVNLEITAFILFRLFLSISELPRKIIFIRGFSKITKVFFIQIYLIKNLLWQRKCSGASTHQLISVSRRKLISTKNISCRKINSNNFSFILKSVQLPEVNRKEAIYCHWKGSAVLVVKNRNLNW